MSPATILPDKNEEINAFAFCMTPDQVQLMDQYESYPHHYDRIPVELLDRKGKAFEGEAYVMKPTGVFKYPSAKYLQVCGMSFMSHHYLHDLAPPKDL